MRKRWILLCVLLLLIGVGAAFLFSGRQTAEMTVHSPDYYALERFDLQGSFEEFYADLYNWYKSNESKDGVHIVHTSFYDEELLTAWRDNAIYATIPQHAFWYFAASPSYLRKMGIVLDARQLQSAMEGARLYLIPDTLGADETETMQAYLREDGVYSAETSDIQTAFTQSPCVEFATYTPDQFFFTWPSEKGQPTAESAPVIYVCTAENMKYFESESLCATGVDSYLKFDTQEAASACSSAPVLSQYGMQFVKASSLYTSAARAGRVDSGLNKAFK